MEYLVTYSHSRGFGNAGVTWARKPSILDIREVEKVITESFPHSDPGVVVLNVIELADPS